MIPALKSHGIFPIIMEFISPHFCWPVIIINLTKIVRLYIIGCVLFLPFFCQQNKNPITIECLHVRFSQVQMRNIIYFVQFAQLFQVSYFCKQPNRMFALKSFYWRLKHVLCLLHLRLCRSFASAEYRANIAQYIAMLCNVTTNALIFWIIKCWLLCGLWKSTTLWLQLNVIHEHEQGLQTPTIVTFNAYAPSLSSLNCSPLYHFYRRLHAVLHTHSIHRCELRCASKNPFQLVYFVIVVSDQTEHIDMFDTKSKRFLLSIKLSFF